MSRAIHLGIDLGTTNSTVCAFDTSQLTLVRNAQGSPLTPSVVRIDAKRNVMVGSKALRSFSTDPDNVRGEFKRLMGTGQKIRFPSSGSELLPEQLSAEVLKSLRADVNEQLGFVPATVVISVPALFELPQNTATSEAARLAGFEKVELIQEPIAAALAAGWSAEDSTGIWMIYDLGGGTFDASVLETRDGLLRIVGHDGDNFLGGRDFDNALLDWVLLKFQAETGLRISRQDEQHSLGVRRLKSVVEEARIELTRADAASVLLPNAFTVDGDTFDIDVRIDRKQLSDLCMGLVDRSLHVCDRLLRAHGLRPNQLSNIVLVGGPTVMPFLRARVQDALGARFREGLDPMTLVAQGAALYAASAALDARPRAVSREEPKGRRLWLHYPAMTSDIAPHVVGRLVDGGDGDKPATVQLCRTDGRFTSAVVAFNDEDAFVISVDVLPRRPNDFQVVCKALDGKEVLVHPSGFTIVQGLTLSDPPLSRSIGVALASDDVQIYFERGAPLPARRSFRHRTVSAVVQGDRDSVLKIPLVQGEFERAHLCRVIGALEIRGDQLTQTLRADSELELTLALDRGGRLSAQALVLATGQVFDQVAHLLVPEASPAALQSGMEATRDWLAKLREATYRHRITPWVEMLSRADQALREVQADVAAAQGGDTDAAQKAKRMLLDIDATLEQCEVELKWPELDEEARAALATAAHWVSCFGTPHEQRLLNEATMAVDQARQAQQVVELQRQVKQVRQLAAAAYFRNPAAWSAELDAIATRVHSARDVPRAERLVAVAREARVQGDDAALKASIQELWSLFPRQVAEQRQRELGHGSSLRLA